MIGVADNKIVLRTDIGSLETRAFEYTQERLDAAHELIAAARLLIQNDFDTMDEVVSVLQDMAEEE